MIRQTLEDKLRHLAEQAAASADDTSDPVSVGRQEWLALLEVIEQLPGRDESMEKLLEPLWAYVAGCGYTLIENTSQAWQAQDQRPALEALDKLSVLAAGEKEADLLLGVAMARIDQLEKALRKIEERHTSSGGVRGTDAQIARDALAKVPADYNQASGLDALQEGVANLLDAREFGGWTIERESAAALLARIDKLEKALEDAATAFSRLGEHGYEGDCRDALAEEKP